MRILLLDGANANTLAITRWLGRRDGFHVHVAAANRFAPAFRSRYCKARHLLPRSSDRARYAAALLELVAKGGYDVLFPVGSHSFAVCAEHRAELSRHCALLTPDPENFRIAESKAATYALAAAAGVPFPHTYAYASREELAALPIAYPVVIKAAFEMGRNVVAYASDRTALLAAWDRMCAENGFGPDAFPIVQQYIDGEGFGFFAFYADGECRTTFMHRRIREYPVTGGASTCAEGWHEEALERSGRALLDRLRWNGVAMVEFKRSRSDGRFHLMEINPKFWGSLELSMASGVDFPGLVIERLGGPPALELLRKPDVRFQWILNGELFHGLERPRDLPAIVRDLFRSRKDLRLSDPLPHAVQVLLVFRYLWRRIQGK